jgi:hypothetical protein
MTESDVLEHTVSAQHFFGFNVATGHPALGVVVTNTWKVRCRCCAAVELQTTSNLFNFDLPLPPPPTLFRLLRHWTHSVAALWQRRRSTNPRRPEAAATNHPEGVRS